ncbi:BrnT family toxin [Stagnimonas aquatica]|uniref:BrnT family toxin n=1 Tax=Stagnimonas aquatica TaxID=2689987 RepID=A0A3N0UYQ3_9GAMM|nr:BrnT family toxin [Stagnimonas aquatica]ROH85613.1 BrnT family toxin [Stagnimonas aquatica]
MRYEWDEAKREANLVKHGLDFVQAVWVHEADFKLTIPSPRGDEMRYVDVAEVQGQLLVLSLVYTLRDEAVRVISLRRANARERRMYAEIKSR